MVMSVVSGGILACWDVRGTSEYPFALGEDGTLCVAQDLPVEAGAVVKLTCVPPFTCGVG